MVEGGPHIHEFHLIIVKDITITTIHSFADYASRNDMYSNICNMPYLSCRELSEHCHKV